MMLRSVLTATAAVAAVSLTVAAPAPAHAVSVATYEKRVENRLDVKDRLNTTDVTATCMDRVTARALGRGRVVGSRALERRCSVEKAFVVSTTSRSGPKRTAKKLLTSSKAFRTAAGNHGWLSVEAKKKTKRKWVVVAAVGQPKLLTPPSDPGTELDNDPPDPLLFYFVDQMAAPLTVHLDGSASYDWDGTIVDHQWFIGPNEDRRHIGAGPTLTHKAPSFGTHQYTLAVTDEDGATAEVTEVIRFPEPPKPVDPEGELAEIVSLTNTERAKVDVAALTTQECLMANAQRHAEAMARDNAMYHQDMADVRAECNASGWLGENVAYNGLGTAEKVMEQWMNSPGHQANILSADFRLIGVGQAYNAEANRWYVAQVFAGGIN